MRILYLLIPMALGVIGVALWAFLWAVRSGQFDDLEKAAHSILFDDDIPPAAELPSPAPGSQDSAPKPP